MPHSENVTTDRLGCSQLARVRVPRWSVATRDIAAGDAEMWMDDDTEREDESITQQG